MSLFMSLTSAFKPLRIVPQSSAQSTLSKGQQAFNTWVKKIETRRHELAQWQATVALYQQKIASIYSPLFNSFTQQRIAFVQALDAALCRTGLSRIERALVEEIICTLLERLLSEFDDDAVKEIYNRYHVVDFDAQEAALDKLRVAFQEGLERDLERDPEVDANELPESTWEDDMQAAQLLRSQFKKKTVKQLAREASQKVDENETSLSVREVYRKLVSALHPDREPDEAARVRKTALMQRVNHAYAKKDLLKLLELQLELEHIDEHTMAGLSEDRLKHYSKVLKAQVKELDQEIAQLERPLKAQFSVHPHQTLSCKSVIPLLMADIEALQRHMRHVKQDMQMLHDLPSFRAWIKAYKRELKTYQAEKG